MPQNTGLDEAYLNSLFEHAPEGIAIVDPEGSVLAVNPHFQTMFGYPEKEVLHRPIDDLIAPGTLSTEAAKLTQTALGGMECEQRTTRRRKNGAEFPVSVLATPIVADKKVIGLYAIYRDISLLVETEQKLLQTQGRLNAIISQAPIALFALDGEARFTFCAGKAMERAGLKEEELLGKSIYDVFPDLTDSLAAASRALTGQTAMAVSEFGSATYEVQYMPVKENGERVQTVIGVARDVTDMILARKQLEFMAQHDILTGLPNRALFQNRVQEAIRRAVRHEKQLALMFIDLDRFKIINDTLGHQMGDRVLQRAGIQCSAVLREVDTVARFGGDEFAVLIEDLEEGPSQAAIVAERLMDAIGSPNFEDEHDVTVNASIGISVYPSDGMNVDTLIKHADAAMYKAKETGRGRFKFYSSELQDSSAGKLTKMALLRRAIEHDGFVLHYQPSIRTKDLAVTGVEALIRMRQPDGTLMPPLEFIALAEATGLIVPVGRWVLEEACRQIGKWKKQEGLQFRMAINLSAHQFHDEGFIHNIRDTLEKFDIPPESFMVEITESMMFPDPFMAQKTLAELRAMHIAVSLDDFGTGFSSLSYLKDFAVDYIKVDRSFIAATPNDKKSCGITRTILALAQNLDMEVIAEGVETAGQYNFLRKIDCQEAQGFYFGRPVEAPALLERFRRGRIVDGVPFIRPAEEDNPVHRK